MAAMRKAIRVYIYEAVKVTMKCRNLRICWMYKFDESHISLPLKELLLQIAVNSAIKILGVDICLLKQLQQSRLILEGRFPKLLFLNT